MKRFVALRIARRFWDGFSALFSMVFVLAHPTSAFAKVASPSVSTVAAAASTDCVRFSTHADGFLDLLSWDLLIKEPLLEL